MDTWSKLAWQKALRGRPLTPAQYMALITISTYADQDGRHAHPGWANLAKDTGMDVRTLKGAVTRLVAGGYLTCTARGGGRGHANEYALAEPWTADDTAGVVGITELEDVVGHSLPAYRYQTRPEETGSVAGPVPEPETDTPDALLSDTQTETPGAPVATADQNTKGVHPLQERGTSVALKGDTGCPPIRYTSGPTSGPLLVADPGAEVARGRPEVRELCEHLRARIAGNGSRTPTIGKDWLDQARLLIDRDKRPLDEAHRLIDWCQQDSFWRSNVLSMPTFRKQYDRLRLQADRPTGNSARPGNLTDQQWQQALLRARQRDAQGGA